MPTHVILVPTRLRWMAWHFGFPPLPLDQNRGFEVLDRCCLVVWLPGDILLQTWSSREIREGRWSGTFHGGSICAICDTCASTWLAFTCDTDRSNGGRSSCEHQTLSDFVSYPYEFVSDMLAFLCRRRGSPTAGVAGSVDSRCTLLFHSSIPCTTILHYTS